MGESLGEVLAAFDRALQSLLDDLEADTCWRGRLLSGEEGWVKDLRLKLVRHLGGEGCLVVAITGGANTGKSTLFNMLVGQAISPVRVTAAATRHLLAGANEIRARHCLEGTILPPFFQPQVYEDPSAVTGDELPPQTLLVAAVPALPGWLVALDTPDIDSIDKENWAVAENIRAAGDVLIAVITGEKYRDERVVNFFRQAREKGYTIFPVMNKADPENNFETARDQLRQFRRDVGIEDSCPCYAVPHDFALEQNYARPIVSVEGGPSLFETLSALDIHAIKRNRFEGALKNFSEQAGVFLEKLAKELEALDEVISQFQRLAVEHVKRYDPLPGAEIGALIQAFIESKRSRPGRILSKTSAQIARGVIAVGHSMRRAIIRRSALTAPGPDAMAAEIHRAQLKSIERVTRDLLTRYTQEADRLPEPAKTLLREVKTISMETVAGQVCAEMLEGEQVSDAFRVYANQWLENWWTENKGKGVALQSLDITLAVTPAMIAAYFAIHSAGFGAAEAIALTSLATGPLAARFFEYLSGGTFLNFLIPWKEEQRARLEKVIGARLVQPALTKLHHYREILDGPAVQELKRLQQLCLKL